MKSDEPLWSDPARAPYRGETRRALDRDIRRAEAEGRTFLETEKAALRRQANDIDRLETMFTTQEVKPWDFNPKTQAHQAYRDALRGFFGDGAETDDPFIAAFNALNAEAARAGTAAPLDPEDGPL